MNLGGEPRRVDSVDSGDAGWPVGCLLTRTSLTETESGSSVLAGWSR